MMWGGADDSKQNALGDRRTINQPMAGPAARDGAPFDESIGDTSCADVTFRQLEVTTDETSLRYAFIDRNPGRTLKSRRTPVAGIFQ